MPFDIVRARPLLQNAALKKLFIEELGWEPCRNSIAISINESEYTLNAIAEKKGFVVWIYKSPDNTLPDHNTRLKLDRKLSETSFEHLIVFITHDDSRQSWMWVRREKGRPLRPRTYEYQRGQAGDSLLQKFRHLYISLEEEESGISIAQVSGRARSAFDVERVTRRFYERFQREHAAFLNFINGIPVEEDRAWYASVMLNRLMFLYFIQKKGFLNGDHNYLRNRLQIIQEGHGRDKFYSFYRYFLLRLFHEGLGKIRHSPELESLIGKVPYINGGIFDVHTIEDTYGKDIQIPDNAFEAIFDYFDDYDWVLDPERSQRNSTGREEINPDVIGYIFEKYINQKQMGAYYTKEDITEYISKNTLIPYIFDSARAKCKVAFENPNGPTIWNLLKENPDRYIYPAVRHGLVQHDNAGAKHSPVKSKDNLLEHMKIMYPPQHLHTGENASPLPSVLQLKPLPPEIAAGLHDVSKRTAWNKPAPAEYALPTEIWREVVARRKRYEEVRRKLESGEVQDVNDLITLNLDIRQFAQDVISNCEGPDLLRAFWNVIKGISILDPTCGSGAFLFAALNILEPLYETCLDRMAEMLEDEAAKHNIVGVIHESPLRHTPHGYPLLPHKKLEDFSNILEQVANHPNKQYFIYKSIILNNLYGVDIMEEAVEICKLRLFLKLVAQVDPDTSKPNFGIEPLPDIDFNIRAGNALVGFTALEQIKKAITTEKHGQVTQKKLLQQEDFDTMKQIEEKAHDVDRLFTLFRQQQTELGGEVTTTDKQELKKRLKTLDDELNRYLASEYGISPNNFKTKQPYEKKFSEWLTSHKPFHWFIEFHAIMNDGGFDVIIGNPPYVEYNKIRKEYTVQGYETEICGNIYAFVLERSTQFSKNRSIISFIIPISMVCTSRMETLRKTLLSSYNNIYLNNYDTIPSTLFTGIVQRNTIVIAKKTVDKKANTVWTTKLQKWYANERSNLFELIPYMMVTLNSSKSLVPKISSQTEQNILSKIGKQKSYITNYTIRHSNNFLMYKRRWSYFLLFTDNIESILLPDGSNRDQQDNKSLYLPSHLDKFVFISVLSSGTFYFHYSVFSDFRHINVTDFEMFNFDYLNLQHSIKGLLSQLGLELVQSYTKYLERRECNYVGSIGKCKVPFYRQGLSKPIIDEIDRVLARHYGFTDEELDFIINYDIKYRMGRDTDDET